MNSTALDRLSAQLDVVTEALRKYKLAVGDAKDVRKAAYPGELSINDQVELVMSKKDDALEDLQTTSGDLISQLISGRVLGLTLVRLEMYEPAKYLVGVSAGIGAKSLISATEEVVPQTTRARAP